MENYKVHYEIKDIDFNIIKEQSIVKEFESYDEADKFIENLAKKEYEDMSDIYINSIMKYHDVDEKEAERIYKEEFWKFIDTVSEYYPYSEAISLDVEYEAGHSYTRDFGKTEMYCPNRSDKNVWVEIGDGDYYVGSEFICESCGSTFNLPTLNADDKSWQTEQILETIRNRNKT